VNLIQPTLTKAIDGRWIIYIDASSLKDSACPRKFYWNVMCGLRPRYEGSLVSMPYGTAIHKAFQNYYSNYTIKDCIMPAIDYYTPYNDSILNEYEFRTTPHLVQTLKVYFKQNPQGSDGIKAILTGKNADGIDTYSVEQQFQFPFYQTSKTIVQLCGTIDINGLYFGQRCLIDHKTVGMSVALDDDGKPSNKDVQRRMDSYFEEYKMNIQPQLYIWVDNHLNRKGDIYLPFVVNGIFVKKVTKKALDEGRFDGCYFQRSKVIEYSPEQMSRFENTVWIM
jgi:hypothetical protein